jgi:hypothetical protein
MEKTMQIMQKLVGNKPPELGDGNPTIGKDTGPFVDDIANRANQRTNQKKSDIDD